MGGNGNGGMGRREDFTLDDLRKETIAESRRKLRKYEAERWVSIAILGAAIGSIALLAAQPSPLMPANVACWAVLGGLAAKQILDIVAIAKKAKGVREMADELSRMSEEEFKEYLANCIIGQDQ